MAPPRRNPVPGDDPDYDAELPRRAKSSSAAKVVLVTLVVGSLVLCCGGAGFLGLTTYWVARNAKMNVATTPAQKQQLARSIARIDLPETFEPDEAFETAVMGFDMKMVNYQRTDRPGTRLILMRNSMLPATATEADRRQMVEQMQGQANRGPRGRVLDTKVVNIEIAGEEVPFQLQTVQESGRNLKQLVGVVPLEDGAVVVILVMNEEDFDLDEAAELLSTLRAADTSAGDAAGGTSPQTTPQPAEQSAEQPAEEPAEQPAEPKSS